MRIFYDASPAPGAGGPPLPPSLDDIKKAAAAASGTPPVVVPPVVVPPVTPPVIVPPITPPVLVPPVVVPPVEEPKLGPDGKPIVEPPVEPEPEKTEAEIAASFWQDVEGKTGRPIKVEYPVGIDPISADGVALRENAVREDAEIQFEQRMKQANPRGYAYMLHLAQGGTDEEFLGKGVGLQLPDKTVIESDVANQTALLKLDLRSRGIEEQYIETIVEKAIKDSKLKELALKAYDNIQTSQKQTLERIETQEKQQIESDRRIYTTLSNNIQKNLATMKFAVPDSEKVEFSKYLTDSVQVLDGKLYIVQPLDQENLSIDMEAMFLRFKKGDLSKIIQKQVATQTSQRLRTQLDATKAKPIVSADPDKTPTKNLSLADVFKWKR